MTNIPYADVTWSPVTGCSKVSQGCRRCWAEALDRRFNKAHKPWTPENAAENVVLHSEKLDEPLHWRRPRTVFVCPTGDLFHEQVPDEFIASVFLIMGRASQHRFLVLTKRAERMRELVSRPGLSSEPSDQRWPLPNVWLGVSAENQHWADIRIPLLLDTPAAHRWVSLEPLLEELNLDAFLYKKTGWHPNGPERVDWVVVGGESGPRHRPMELAWADRISEQCHAANMPYFGKQIAARLPDQPLPGDLGRRETP